jgi:hypothetical protein
MANAINPAAPHHLPVFITGPGETDAFLVGCAIFLVLMVIAAGAFYFKLHALPEHLAHKNASKLQFEVVAVLALLALLTHTNWLWVAALLLALIPVPNLYEPLAGMADSLAKMAGWRRPPALPAEPRVPSAATLDEIAAIVRSGAGAAQPEQIHPAAATGDFSPEPNGEAAPPAAAGGAPGSSGKRARPKKERA